MDSNAHPSAPTLLEAMQGPLWRQLLSKAIKEAGHGGISRVAERLGVSRTYVSLVHSGAKHPVPQAFVDRVIDRLHIVAECPATQQPQRRGDCRRIALGAAPTHNPLAMRIWKCCQTCAHKPEVSS